MVSILPNVNVAGFPIVSVDPSEFVSLVMNRLDSAGKLSPSVEPMLAVSGSAKLVSFVRIMVARAKSAVTNTAVAMFLANVVGMNLCPDKKQ